MKTTTLPQPTNLTSAAAAHNAAAAEYTATKAAGNKPAPEYWARVRTTWTELQDAEAAHAKNRMRPDMGLKGWAQEYRQDYIASVDGWARTAAR